MARRTDLVIVGGGLAGGLLTLALARLRPEIAVTLVEAGLHVGGNHIWSFFDGDVAPAHRWLVEPLVSYRWPEHEVRFPGFRRVLRQAYNSIESERLDTAVRTALPPERLLCETAIAAFDPAGVVLASGDRVEADAVIDARGAGEAYRALDLGWQKFAGRLLRLREPHGLERPVIMDATVAQSDDYRFVYLLPFGPRALFVEDTYYSTEATLDPAELARRIGDYADAQGWTVESIEREEGAALPIAMGGRFDRLWPVGDPVARIGMAAGLFQPMTGYSLPDAVRTAMLVAEAPDLSSAALAPMLRAHAAQAWNSRGFFRLLARLLFRAAEPPERWRVLERFYRLDAGLIARFYAGTSTPFDKLRVLAGKPPVPLGRAFAVLRDEAA